MRAKRTTTTLTVISALLFAVSFIQNTSAQQNTTSKSWSSSTQQGSPDGSSNPFRTTTTHNEVNSRSIDKIVVEALGPDGRYVPYSETERESVKVNDTTERRIERTYARNADGQRTLTQQTDEEARKLSGGASKVVRTTANPDANGSLQIIQRMLIDSRQVAPASRDTTTTLFSADGSGGLSASMRIEEHERQTDPKTVEFKKATSLFDGTGHWNVSEVREGTAKQDEAGTNKEERVLRPDADGKMSLVERTVTREANTPTGEKRDTTETYSTNIPGQAGHEGLKLVKRESTVQRTDANGARRSTRQVESADAGDPTAALRTTQQAIDIVRPGTNGVAQQTSTIVTTDANGHTNAVWVDMGKSDEPAAVKVDPSPAPKKK